MAEPRQGLSLIVPVFKNEENIPDLLDVLADFAARHQDAFEAILVVDGSPDASWRMLRAGLIERSIPSQLILLARNFGAFPAVRRGMESSSFEITAVMAADLQEPPELIEEFYERLSSGEADLAVGSRTRRSDGWIRTAASNMYWAVYRRFIMPDVPRGGVDVFACSSAVRKVLVSMHESNTSLVGQVLWVGFRRLEIPYERRPRRHGRTTWSFKARIRYMLDSVFSFSDLPIMVLMWLGVIGLTASTLGSVVIFFSWAFGRIDVPGYTPTILGILFTGSLLLAGQGIIGAYVWRISENTKNRPLTITALHEVFAEPPEDNTSNDGREKRDARIDHESIDDPPSIKHKL